MPTALAATSGLVFVLTLFLQQELHRTPAQAALGLPPLSVGIIIASIAAHQLLERLGRDLVLIGLVLTLTGTVALLALVVGTDPTPWTIVGPIFLTGLGLGMCFGTIYQVTLGDIAAAEAGSASGSLTAVQQVANSIGAAAVTTVYFHTSGGTATSLAVVATTTVVCCGLVRLLPRPGRGATHPVTTREPVGPLPGAPASPAGRPLTHRFLPRGGRPRTTGPRQR
ncbi:MFS transporter [Nocardia sp. NPDC023852]|uniref:MFS transporter n=1 Tax=Nocardia sp. NPDC023852 TaxID=3154697 RepID=UPI0033D40976